MIRLRDQQSRGHGLPQLAKADLEWLSWPNCARQLSATLLGDFKLGVWDDTVEAGQAELYKKNRYCLNSLSMTRGLVRTMGFRQNTTSMRLSAAG